MKLPMCVLAEIYMICSLGDVYGVLHLMSGSDPFLEYEGNT